VPLPKKSPKLATDTTIGTRMSARFSPVPNEQLANTHSVQDSKSAGYIGTARNFGKRTLLNRHVGHDSNAASSIRQDPIGPSGTKCVVCWNPVQLSLCAKSSSRCSTPTAKVPCPVRFELRERAFHRGRDRQPRFKVVKIKVGCVAGALITSCWL